MTAPQPPAPAPVYLAPVPPPKAPAAPKPATPAPAPRPRHWTPLLVAGCAVAVVAVAGVWALAGPVAGMATAGGLAAAGGAVHATRRLARRRETTRAASARPPGAARPSAGPRPGGRAGIRPRGGWPSFGRGRGSAPGGGGDRSPGGGSPGRGRGRGRGRPSWFPGRRGADKQDAARSGDRSRAGQPEGRRKGRQPRGGGKGGAARPGGSGTRGGPASGDGRKSNDHASGSSRRRGWRRFLPGRRGGRPGSGGNSGGSNGSGGGAAPGGKSGGKSAGGTDPASTPGGRRFRDRRRRKPRSDSPPTGGGRGKGGTPAAATPGAGGSGRGLRKLVDRLHRSKPGKPAEAKGGTGQKPPARPVPPTRRTGRAAGADGRMVAAKERLAAVMGRQAEKPPEKPAAKGAGRKVCRACHGTGKHPTCGFDAPCPWCTKDLTLRIEPRDGGPAEYVSWSRDQRIWPSDYKSRVYIVDRQTGTLTEVTKDPGRSPSPAGPSESAGGGPPPTPAPGTPTRSRRGQLNDSLQDDVDPAQWGAMPPPHPARQRWQDRMDNRGGSMEIQSMRNDWEPLMARWEEKLREAHEISQQAAAAIEGSPVHRGTSDIARELAGLTGQLAGRVPEVTATTRQADEAYWALADGTLDRPNTQAWTAD